MGGNRIKYPGEVGTPTAEMLLVKILLNSVISTRGAKFMSIDIKNFYLATPMERYEYLKLKLCNIPEEIIKEYNLLHIATRDKSVYVEVRKGMYGVTTAGRYHCERAPREAPEQQGVLPEQIGARIVDTPYETNLVHACS